MRCYLLRGGHIVAVEELIDLSDEEAIAEAEVLYSNSEVPLGSVEVWDQTRVIVRHPPVAQEPARFEGGAALVEDEARWHMVLMPSR